MHLHLSLNHPLPLYEQIADQIKENILSGELSPGESLPSIRGLALELTTSVITVKRAYQELESGDWIYTRPGLGTFVSAVDADKIKQAVLEKVENRLRGALEEAGRGGLPEEQVSRLLEKLIKERRKQ